MDDGGRTGRALHEFEFASGDILTLRKAVIDLEAFELCVIVAVVRPQHPGWAVAAEASRENATSSEILRASCIVWCPSEALRSPKPIAPQLLVARALPI